MGAGGKCWIFLLVMALALLGSVTVEAASYQQALDEYSDHNYSISYKKAMKVARASAGPQRAKAMVLAAAAVLELDREDKARALFKKALEVDPQLELPGAVRSRRVQRFFAELRSAPVAVAVAAPMAAVPASPSSGFGRFETYLPFGLNQVVQEKYVLGLVFAGMQGFGAFYAFAQSQDALRVKGELESVRVRAIETGDDINPSFLDYEKKSHDTIKRMQQTAQLSVGLAVVSYVASVLEAGLNPPTTTRVVQADPSSWRLFAMEYRQKVFQLELMNPMLARQGLQLSIAF